MPSFYIVCDEENLREKIFEEVAHKNITPVAPTENDLRIRCNYLFLMVGFGEKTSIDKAKEIFDYIKREKVKANVILPKGIESETIKFARDEAKENKVQIVDLGRIDDEELVINKLLRGIFSYGYGEEEVTIGNKPWESEKKVEAKTEEKVQKEFTFNAPKLIKIPEITPVRIKRKRRVKFKFNFKRVVIFLVCVFWIVALPFLLLFATGLISRFCLSKLSSTCFAVSKMMAYADGKMFFIFDDGKRTSNQLYTFSQYGVNLSDAFNISKKLQSQISANESYDIDKEANKLYLVLNDLANQSQFLVAEAKYNFLLPHEDYLQLNKYFENLKVVAKKLPELLGSKQKVNYMVLLQDSSVLKPSGGEIKKIAIISFQNGRLIEKNIMGVGEADKELRGVVTPPAGFAKYFKRNNFYLADSNWDNDFRISAAQAAWFLNKEVGVDIYGVIAIDENLFNSLNNWQDVFNNLNSKNILIYTKDGEIADAMQNLNWDGGVKIEGPLAIALTETSVGEKSDNIVRSANWEISEKNHIFNSSLVYNLNNQSDTTYKTYVRLETANGEIGKYVEILAHAQTKVSFNWSTRGGDEETVYIRKQPGVGTLPFNVSLTSDKNIRYNTNLESDFQTIWQK